MNENNNTIPESGETLAENKLIILYLMHNVNCTLSNLQILKLLYDFEGFNYYYFQHLLSDLVEKKYIMSYKQNEEWFYEITSLGSEVLELTENMLPGIIKHKLNLITKSLLKDVTNELIISAEYIPENNNTYTTKCKLSEAHQTVFELNILCNSQSEAKKIAENWKANANEYYSDILNMISNN
ncbi:MAG: DUF4364 family protein [Clostridia bacterium]|nr:DUF4364 family protein [Clostridia bacterium]